MEQRYGDPWNEDTRALWARIDSHPIGGGDGGPALFARLRREQRWSARRAAQALREYRRFAFLCCVAPDEMTPSREVDAVWHTHLLFTRDYWDGFCARALQRPLHHAPASLRTDAPRHAAQYARTRAEYARWFGTPPARGWPARGPRLRRWTRRAAAALAAVLAPALAWAQGGNALQGSVLDWNGGDFLRLYVGLLLGVVIGSLLLRGWLRRRATTPQRHVGTLSAPQLGWLMGGEARALEVAVTELHRRGALEWDARHGRLGPTGAGGTLEAPYDAVLRGLSRHDDPQLREATRALAPVRAELERRGLWLDAGQARRIALLSALPAAALLLFGATKIAIGVLRDRPVLLLVLLAVVTAVFLLAMLFTPPGRSGAGDRERIRLRLQLGDPEHLARQPDRLATAVALGGVTLLAGTGLAGWHEARAASGSGSSDGGSSSDSSGSGDSGSDGGSSGCGGCGGGGGD